MLPIKDDKNYFKSKIYLVLLPKCTLWRRNYVTRVRKINSAERIPQTKFPHATLIVIVHSHTRMWERVHDLQNEKCKLAEKEGKGLSWEGNDVFFYSMELLIFVGIIFCSSIALV